MKKKYKYIKYKEGGFSFFARATLSLELPLYSRNLLKLLHIIKKSRIKRILRNVFAVLWVEKQTHSSTDDIVL